MNIHDDFRDLAPLRPDHDPRRWTRMLERIEAAAAPELARRAGLASPGLLMLLSGWTRPAISAAALAAAAAATVIALQQPTSAAAGVSDALGMPEPVAVWLDGGQAPSVEELVVLLEEDTR